MPREKVLTAVDAKDTFVDVQNLRIGHHIDLSNEESLELLCERCSDLDIGLTYSAIAKYEYGKVLANLGDMETLKLSSCPLCQFFAMVSETNGIIEAHQNYFDVNPTCIQLRAITVENLYFHQEDDDSILAGLRNQKQFVFCLVPCGDDGLFSGIDGLDWLSIGVITPDPSFTTISEAKKDWMLQTRRVIPDRIPYSLLTEWMSNCRNNHDEYCTSRPPEHAPCLRVIDCSTLKIIKTPQRCDYIALSYVWGSSQARGPGPVSDGTGSETLKMPEEMALVVTDAIQVVLQLGYRFLWIDKYCIDQQNASEKALQMANMGSIFRSSVVVIVAAGGMDSSFGLPGVSRRSRIPQPSLNLWGHTWLSNVQHPALTIRKSAWITRGWTFQEAVFSKRRIYFTEHQVAFECEEYENVRTEALHLPHNVAVDEPWYPEFVFEPRLAASPIESGLDYIAPQIEEYSSRDLTCESDALNGFRSFYTQMERKDRPVYQFFGLPIVRQEEAGWDWQSSNDSGSSDDSDNDSDSDSDDDSKGDSDDDRDDDSHDDGDSDGDGDDDGDEDDEDGNSTSSGECSTVETEFNPVDSLLVALCWYHARFANDVDEEPKRWPMIRRRRMFPSWSWLGWTGRISYEDSKDLYSKPLPREEDNNDQEKPPETEAEIEVQVEDKQGCLWPWRTWDDVQKISSLDTSDQLSGRLRVMGYCEKVKLEYADDEEIYVNRNGYKPKAQLYISSEGSSGQPSGQGDSLMSSRKRYNDQSWRFLSLGQAMMLVTEVGEGEYSRLGITIPQKLKKDLPSSKRHQTRRELVQFWLV